MSRDLWPRTSGALGPVDAGKTVTVTTLIQNQGTENVSQSFSLEFKLITTSSAFGHPNTDFYDPGARLLSMQLITEDVNTGATGIEVSTTFTFPADLAPGRYTVVGAVDSTLAVVESDEANNYIPFGTTRIWPEDRVLRFDGTEQADDLFIGFSDAITSVTLNGYTESFFASDDVRGYDFRALGGDDHLRVFGNAANVRLDGGDGNDKIIGGDGNELLVGGAGKDDIDGGAGNDRLNGNGGNDKLYGNVGADRLYGYAGNDYLDGGSSGDRLEGGAGLDTLLGQGGNDRFFTADNEVDHLFGASGKDTSQSDAQDLLSSVTASL